MPGTTRLAFDVIIIDDSLIESSESFSLRLFPSEEESSVVFSPAVAVVTISDNDSKLNSCTLILFCNAVNNISNLANCFLHCSSCRNTHYHLR